MEPALLALLARTAAFWVAFAGHARRRAPGRVRYALGLGVGAACAHAAFVALFAPLDLEGRSAPWSGCTVLAVPLGVLAVAPWCPRARRAFLAPALRSLVPALAMARLGCVAAGCCTGRAGHPTALYELGGLLVLGVFLERLEPRRVPGGFAAGFGLLRLVLEPLRAPSPLGPGRVAPGLLAAGWIAIGLGALMASRRAGSRRRRLACATGSSAAIQGAGNRRGGPTPRRPDPRDHEKG